jgi:hypothetical protein
VRKISAICNEIPPIEIPLDAGKQMAVAIVHLVGVVPREAPIHNPGYLSVPIVVLH